MKSPKLLSSFFMFEHYLQSIGHKSEYCCGHYTVVRYRIITINRSANNLLYEGDSRNPKMSFVSVQVSCLLRYF